MKTNSKKKSMLEIKPIRDTGGGKEFTLITTFKEIIEIIGFEDNVTDMDDQDKVKASWGFEDENGRQGFIWCYKYYGDVKKCTYWSADGDKDLMLELFGNKIK